MITGNLLLLASLVWNRNQGPNFTCRQLVLQPHAFGGASLDAQWWCRRHDRRGSSSLTPPQLCRIPESHGNELCLTTITHKGIKTFRSQQRPGFIMAEAQVLVLETLSHARARGAHYLLQTVDFMWRLPHHLLLRAMDWAAFRRTGCTQDSDLTVDSGLHQCAHGTSAKNDLFWDHSVQRDGDRQRPPDLLHQVPVSSLVVWAVLLASVSLAVSCVV
jgi:hypothetical protein